MIERVRQALEIYQTLCAEHHHYDAKLPEAIAQFISAAMIAEALEARDVQVGAVPLDLSGIAGYVPPRDTASSP